ncbi:MAG: response regulator transcription factor [Bacilli bacterium]|nr:response regulator transcription factor [Bacilli bacterium]
MSYLIYSVEDDADISHIINATLSKTKYEVATFSNAKDFFEAFNHRKPNMILLDLMLPDMDGMDIIKEIRKDKNNNSIQIIIISAKRLLMDKVDGFDYGADDYIEKPFDILELLSRINSKVRRFYSSHILTYNDLVLNTEKYTCKKGEQNIELTNMEFELLKILLSNLGKPVSRDEIISDIYGNSIALETRSVDMHINSLRKKLDDRSGNIIRTIYGMGYKIG